MRDQDEARLHDYLDGELGEAARARLEEEVRSDVGLRAQLRELEALRTALSELPRAAEPPARIWTAIESRIGGDTQPHESTPVLTLLPEKSAGGAGRRRWGHVSFSVPQLAAAAVVLLCLGAFGTWAALGGDMTLGTPEVAEEGPGSFALPASSGAISPLAPDALVMQYEPSIAELSAILEAGEGVLAPETLQVVRESLAAIDAAVEEALVALDDDPANEVVRRILQQNLDKKVDLLQRAAEAVQGIA